MTLTYKILKDHLLSGNLIPGEEISIRIDQTLTQDSTGTMAYLQFEAMGIDRVKTEKSLLKHRASEQWLKSEKTKATQKWLWTA